MTIARTLAALATACAALGTANAHTASAQTASAQTASPRVARTGSAAWLAINGDAWFTPTLGVQTEIKIERSKLGEAPANIELRAGLERPLGGGAVLAVGSMIVHGSPYGPFPALAPTNEFRGWEQLTLDQHVGRVSLSHRYRFEQRFIERPHLASDGSLGPSDRVFRLRTRYQLKGNVPLAGPTSSHAPYASAFDEVFVSVGAHTALNLLDQNRAGVGVGARWTPWLRTEMDYLNQVILRADGRQVENNNVVQLSLSLTHGAPRR